MKVIKLNKTILIFAVPSSLDLYLKSHGIHMIYQILNSWRVDDSLVIFLLIWSAFRQHDSYYHNHHLKVA